MIGVDARFLILEFRNFSIFVIASISVLGNAWRSRAEYSPGLLRMITSSQGQCYLFIKYSSHSSVHSHYSSRW